jgi:hypothetical protein
MSDEKELPPPLNLEKPRHYRTRVPQCIYCDSKDNLTDEHVIAFQLGGHIIIDNGSCEECRRKTQKYERICATEMFGAYRLSIGGPMRRRKRNWPYVGPLFVLDEHGKEHRIEIPWHQRPASLLLPRMTPPGFISGAPAVIKNIWHHLPDISVLPPGVIQSGRGIRVGRVYPRSFTQLLAKIAHGTALVLLEGYTPDWDWPARRIARGELDEAKMAIGGYLDDFPRDPEFPHWIVLEGIEKDGRVYVVANIRLYAYLGTPIYSVVVAITPDLQSKSEKTLSPEQFLDTKRVIFPLTSREGIPVGRSF